VAASRQPRLSLLEQARSRETRARLVEAARDIWSDSGFETSTVDEICERAGVAKGTFYFYFRRKDDLLLELAADVASRAAEAVDHLAADATTKAAAEEVVQLLAASSSRTPRPLLARIMAELAARGAEWDAVRGDRPDLPSGLHRILERGQRRGEIGPGWDLGELAALLTLLVLQGITAWASGADEPLQDILVRRVDVFLSGASSAAPGAAGPADPGPPLRLSDPLKARGASPPSTGGR
jgi:AcrR family transcriptional regulator